MTSTESYTAVADHARTAVERSAQMWNQGARALTEQADAVARFPQIDLTEAVHRYFEYLQRGVEVNHQFVVKWAEIVSGWTNGVREQVQAIDEAARGHSQAIGDWISGEAESVQKVVHDQAEQADRLQHEQARAQYEGLTRSELADKLADRDLPKTGTVDELIERLVTADVG